MSPNPIYLHNHSEFEDLIRIVSAELDINPVLYRKGLLDNALSVRPK